MGKSIRSKSMRKNRALLRATVIDPVVHKRQVQLANALVKSLEDKKKNANSSLMGLRKLTTKQKPAVEAAEEDDNDDEQFEDMEDDNDADEGKSGKKGSKSDKKPKGKKAAPGTKGKAFKASRTEAKPMRPAKEMVWFK